MTKSSKKDVMTPIEVVPLKAVLATSYQKIPDIGLSLQEEFVHAELLSSRGQGSVPKPVQELVPVADPNPVPSAAIFPGEEQNPIDADNPPSIVIGRKSAPTRASRILHNIDACVLPEAVPKDKSAPPRHVPLDKMNLAEEVPVNTDSDGEFEPESAEVPEKKIVKKVKESKSRQKASDMLSKVSPVKIVSPAVVPAVENVSIAVENVPIVSPNVEIAPTTTDILAVEKNVAPSSP
jgi:hypothetical protein